MSFFKKSAERTPMWSSAPNAPGEPAAADSRGNAGEYRLLHKYLRDRYANRVVLTFAQIEDLLGFALPDDARRQSEWWVGAGPAARRSAQAESWVLASRTATVNLSAQIVVFERDIPPPVR